MRTTLLLAMVISLFAAPGEAKTKRPPPVWDELGVETSIAFPNHGTIRNFEANDTRGLWIEDSQRRWVSDRVSTSRKRSVSTPVGLHNSINSVRSSLMAGNAPLRG